MSNGSRISYAATSGQGKGRAAIMITQAMWTHGHTMKVEDPAGLSGVWRAGFFARAVGRPNTTNWFHFAVPTPVIVKTSGR